ncbi:asialoglycoprotein receptor 2-like [Babylonia areolata]|uniref:asialoglycoprotein receptor 2-like n=1 Tax=Babylonia areolata TaxID=304850 RepID=UPI003FD58CE6
MRALCCEIPLLLCCFLAYAASQACPNEWTYFDGSCYITGTDQLSWADAEQMCRIFESDLVVLETRKENEFLKRHLSAHRITTQSPNTHVWIGATDIFNESQFMWLNTFQRVGFSDWSRGEPNTFFGTNSEDCVQMRREFGWQWNDESCARKCYFVCEMRAIGGSIIG